DLPVALHQRIFFKDEGSDVKGETRQLEIGPVPIQHDPPLVLAPPLRGSAWVVTVGFSNDSHHRRALVPLKDKVFIPQRYAIDWAKLGPNGKLFHGDPTKNVNYYSYGEEVLAVADAVVAAVKDGMPENIPTAQEKAVPLALDTAAGNFILLDLGQS